ncbi:MAG: response regulator, partial [Bacteroidetes bacterium]
IGVFGAALLASYLPRAWAWIEARTFFLMQLLGLWSIGLAWANDFPSFQVFFIYLYVIGTGFFFRQLRWLHVHYAWSGAMVALALALSEAAWPVRLETGLFFLLVWTVSYIITFYLKSQEIRIRAALAKESQLNHALLRSKLFLEKTEKTARVGGWEVYRDRGELRGVIGGKALAWLGMEDTSASQPISRLQPFFEPDDWRELFLLLDRCLMMGDPVDLVKTMNAGGHKRTIRITGRREFLSDSPPKVFGIYQDVTREHQAVLELQDAKEKAVTLAENKARFLSVMSHEIRTPLNAVIGLSRHLVEGHPRPDQQRSLESLQVASETLLALINDVLDLSKMEAGRLDLQLISFELKNRLQGILRAFEVLAKDKGLALHLDFEPGLPSVVVADPYRLTQVLNNLISNAIKFTSQGSVTLRVNRSIAAPAPEGKLLLHLEVVDTGMGMNEEVMSRIFEPFDQGRSGASQVFGGSGLGLTICRDLVSLMGGQIKVESQEGIGSCFCFDLPVRVEQKARGKSGLEKGQSAGLKRILMAEDNEVNAWILAQLLEKWGHEVVLARDGEEAVEAAREHRFDLILMDLNMPRLDGMQATQLIRAFDAQVPIIALSADTSNEGRRAARFAGMNDFHPKPFVPDMLQEQIACYARWRTQVQA